MLLGLIPLHRLLHSLDLCSTADALNASVGDGGSQLHPHGGQKYGFESEKRGHQASEFGEKCIMKL